MLFLQAGYRCGCCGCRWRQYLEHLARHFGFESIGSTCKPTRPSALSDSRAKRLEPSGISTRISVRRIGAFERVRDLCCDVTVLCWRARTARKGCRWNGPRRTAMCENDSRQVHSTRGRVAPEPMLIVGLTLGTRFRSFVAFTKSGRDLTKATLCRYAASPRAVAGSGESRHVFTRPGPTADSSLAEKRPLD